jgi:DNA topoisomerase-6 subunit B
MAMKRTGGERTDELLGRNGSGPEGLPHSIIVTPDGVEGEVPAPVTDAVTAAASSNGAAPDAEPTDDAEPKPKARGKRERVTASANGHRKRPRASRGRTRTGKSTKRGRRAKA